MAVRPWIEVRRQLEVALRVGSVGSLTDSQLLSRFLAKGEGAELAFETLVARHGGMVLSVCRSLLGTSHDAEDAFQATFLVLVRRAEAIRKHDSLACWLHGVARRIALRAKENERRQRKRENERARPEGIFDDPDRSEAGAMLHEEIARLPEHYRTAVLLCELGGRTHAEAAAQLACPIGTVSGRVARAKAILKERITRRGLIASSTVIAALSDTTAKAAALEARARTSLILARSAAASRLADLYLGARFSQSLKIAAALLAPTVLGVGLARPGAVETPVPAAKVQTQSVAPTAIVRRSAPVIMNWREEPIIDVTVAPDGKTFAAIRADSSVTIWDIETDRERFTYRGHNAPLLSLKFSPDGGSVVTSDASREMKVWTLDTGREQLSMTLSPSLQGEPVVATTPCGGEAPSGA